MINHPWTEEAKISHKIYVHYYSQPQEVYFSLMYNMVLYL